MTNLLMIRNPKSIIIHFMNNLKIKSTLLLITIFLSLQSFAQETINSSRFNFDFEQPGLDGNKIAKDWIAMPRGTDKFVFLLDSTVKHSGKYSLLIKPSGLESVDVDQNFGAAGFRIKNTYKGKRVEVTAFMKCENVIGSIKLMLRVDGKEHKILQYGTMKEKTIAGTQRWKEYKLEIDIPENGIDIYIGGMLIGSGKLWIDDFRVQVDGKDINLYK